MSGKYLKEISSRNCHKEVFLDHVCIVKLYSENLVKRIWEAKLQRKRKIRRSTRMWDNVISQILQKRG